MHFLTKKFKKITIGQFGPSSEWVIKA